MTDEPWRRAFDAARDPYAARNALGVASDGGITQANADARYLPKLGIIDGSAASAGFVGEFKTASQLTPQTLTTVTTLSLASVTLSAGEWEIQGAVGYSGNVATTINYGYADVSSVNNTLANVLDQTQTQFWNGNTIFNILATHLICTPRFVVNTSGAPTYRINAFADFAVSTCSAIGKIWARRIR